MNGNRHSTHSYSWQEKQNEIWAQIGETFGVGREEQRRVAEITRGVSNPRYLPAIIQTYHHYHSQPLPHPH